MKRVIYSLFALLVIASGSKPLLADFSTGEKLSHNLSVCLAKQDAIDIVNAHKSGGKEAAGKVWMEREGCGNADVFGPNAGKVVYAVKLENGVASVVEIVAEGRVIAYFITTQPVNKPQRNS